MSLLNEHYGLLGWQFILLLASIRIILINIYTIDPLIFSPNKI